MNSNTNKRRLNDVDSNTDKAPDPRNQSIATPTIFASSPITDRASTFIAHFHPHDPRQPSPSKSTTQTIKSFQNDPAFSTADHRMAAWRRASTQRTLLPTGGASGVTYTTSSDDDGEKYAGKRLEKVLNELNVQGTVVVARWYGGVLLGPVRFTHIENVARDAIARWTRSVGGAGAGDAHSGGGGKRVKTGDDSSPASGSPAKGAPTEAQKAADEATRVRLAEQLVYRDNSIAVLRALLAEKKNEQHQQRIDESSTQKLQQQQQQESIDPAVAGSSPAPGSNILKGKGNLASQSASPADATPPSASAARAAETDAVSKHTSISTSTSPINPSSVSPPPPPSTATANNTATKPHAQPLDYTALPLARLRQLEKARDATIAFILKQIDKAEADEKKAKANGEGDGGGLGS